MSYWMNQGRAGDEYYGGFHQHHYDEDAAIGPRNPNTFRHGAGVNYDDYQNSAMLESLEQKGHSIYGQLEKVHSSRLAIENIYKKK